MALRGQRDLEDGNGVTVDDDFARRTLLLEIAKKIIRTSVFWATVLACAVTAIPF